MDDKRYEEIGRNYRFLVAWRHIAFAGDLILFFGVLALTFALYIQIPVIAWLIPGLAWPAGVLLRIMDRQSRTLYYAILSAGKALEGKKGGYFTQLSRIRMPAQASAFRRAVQFIAADVLFLGSSAWLLLLAIFLYLWTRGWYFPV